MKNPSFLEKTINLFFPRRCLCCGALTGNHPLCPACREKLLPVSDHCCIFCGRDKEYCRCDYGKALSFERIVSAYYYEETGRALLHQFKFDEKRQCYDAVLKKTFLNRVRSFYATMPIDYVIPVPMYEKERNRFDQALYLARSVAQMLHVPCRTDLLYKTVKILPQHEQPRENRKQNVSGAFSVRNGEKIKGRCILLVDDVATTFSTLNECTRILLQAGCDRVLCASLMTTLSKNERAGRLL